MNWRAVWSWTRDWGWPFLRDRGWPIAHNAAFSALMAAMMLGCFSIVAISFSAIQYQEMAQSAWEDTKGETMLVSKAPMAMLYHDLVSEGRSMVREKARLMKILSNLNAEMVDLQINIQKGVLLAAPDFRAAQPKNSTGEIDFAEILTWCRKAGASQESCAQVIATEDAYNNANTILTTTNTSIAEKEGAIRKNRCLQKYYLEHPSTLLSPACPLEAEAGTYIRENSDVDKNINKENNDAEKGKQKEALERLLLELNAFFDAQSFFSFGFLDEHEIGFVVLPSAILTMIVAMGMGTFGSVLFMVWGFLLQGKQSAPGQPVRRTGPSFRWLIFRPLQGAGAALAIFVLIKSGQLAVTHSSHRTDDIALNPFVLGFFGIVSGFLAERAMDRIARAAGMALAHDGSQN